MELTSEQIETLNERHTMLTAEIREAARRLEEIRAAVSDGEIADDRPFKDIGTPLKERPV